MTGLTASILSRGSFARDAWEMDGVIPRFMALLCFIIGIYVFISTTAMTIHGWSPVPYWDQWDELILSDKQLLSPWLYSQHNEHRILFPRLFFAIDTFGFAETNEFNFSCNIALPLVLAGLIVFVAHRHVSRRKTDTLWIAGVVLTLLFSAMQYENFVWGFQIQFWGVELAAAASISCLVLARRSWLSLTASIGFSAIGVYTLASGITVPFLAIPLALWAQRSKAQITVLSIAAVSLLASYLYGYVSPAQHSDPLFTIFRPGLVRYVVAEIGNPFGQIFSALVSSHRLIMVLDSAFGTLGLGLFATTALVLLRRGRVVGGPQLFFVGIAFFVVAVAFLTGLGRLEFGAGQALSVRYASPTLLFWLALAMLAIFEVQHHRPDLRLIATSLSLVLVIGLAWEQSRFVKTGLAWASPRREAMTGLLANVDDTEALKGIYPLPDRLKQLAVQLRARHLAVFADEWSTWLGTPLTSHIRIGNSAECQGGIDLVTRLPVSGTAQWRVSGWSLDNARRAPPQRLVLADSTGRVVGYALAGYASPGHEKRSGWRGHFTADKTVSVMAYALIDDGHTACPLPRTPDAS